LAGARRREIKPITVLTPIPRYWSWWLRATWPFADRSAFIKRPLLALSFIHVAHWGLVKRLPGHRLRHRYILFQSNYDGETKEYAEAFARNVAWRVRGMWGDKLVGAYGFPGPDPPNDFVDYVIAHAVDEPYHYYSRYPAGTVRTIRAAIPLREHFERFRREAADLGPEEFAAAWRRFLTQEQRSL
jgi:hypothetical protein